MDKYNMICDYLQEAVNIGTMTEEDAAVFEAMAAEKYGIEGEVDTIEESTDDVVVVDSSFMEAVLDDIIAAYEAADTTEAATLKAFISSAKELASTYQNNIKSASKCVKSNDLKEAKKQIADAKKSLSKLKVTTVAYKDSIPGTAASAIVHYLAVKSVIKSIVVALSGAGLAAHSIADKHTSKSAKKAEVAIGLGLAAAGGIKAASEISASKKASNDLKGTHDLGKQTILLSIKENEEIITKLEKAIEKKQSASK